MDEESYVDILIVENNFSKTIYKKGHSSLPKMITCPAVRYDYLRKSKFDFKKIKRKSSNCVLWAGQPEIDSNLSTLKILIPILNKLSVTLLFKAHPADKFYKKAGYLNYLNKLRMPWIDITGHKVDADLFDPVDLVITQFSTFAIEAGFYGIPSLSVLFDSAGKNLLLERTGSIATSTIVNDACFFIYEQKGLLDYLKMCLTNQAQRKKVLLNFDQLYKTQSIQLPRLLRKIEDIIPTVLTK